MGRASSYAVMMVTEGCGLSMTLSLRGLEQLQAHDRFSDLYWALVRDAGVSIHRETMGARSGWIWTSGMKCPSLLFNRCQAPVSGWGVGSPEKALAVLAGKGGGGGKAVPLREDVYHVDKVYKIRTSLLHPVERT